MVKKASGHLNTLRIKELIISLIPANEQTVIASSKSVFGPFRQKEVKPIDASAKNIDSFLFKDDDGKYYLYHVRFNKGNYLWVAEFDIKKGSIKPETLKQCMDCTEALGKDSEL